MEELTLTLLGLAALILPLLALIRLGRSAGRQPLPEPPLLAAAPLRPPAHDLYCQGEGEALLESLPSLALDYFVPLATALGLYAEALEEVQRTAPELLDPQTRLTSWHAMLLRINLAETLSELGRHQEARALLSAPLEDPFLDTGRRATLAWVLTLEGRAAEARSALNGAVAGCLGAEYRAEVHLTGAFVALAQGELDEAHAALREARSSAVRASTVRNVLFLEAELASRRGDHSDALRLFQLAADHRWRWQGGAGLLRWGRLLAQLGRTEEAHSAWARCVAQDPQSSAASEARALAK